MYEEQANKILLIGQSVHTTTYLPILVKTAMTTQNTKSANDAPSSMAFSLVGIGQSV
jgi:hypothetical protein